MKKTAKKTTKAKAVKAKTLKPAVKELAKAIKANSKQQTKDLNSLVKAPAAQLVAPMLPPEAEGVIADVKTMAAQVSLLKLQTDEDALTATRMLTQLKGLTNALESKRKSFTKPLKDHVKKLEALFKPYTDVLEKADRELRTKFLAYNEEKQNASRLARQQLLDEAEKAQEAGDFEKATQLALQTTELDTAQAIAKSTAVEDGTVRTNMVWTFEVLDLAAVPTDYFILDETKVRAAIRAGTRDIAGIRIFQKAQLAVSSSLGVSVETKELPPAPELLAGGSVDEVTQAPAEA